MMVARNQTQVRQLCLDCLLAQHRAAFSTLEFLVSISIASVLTLGLSGAIFIAGKSLELPPQSPETQALIGNDFGRLRDNFNDAVSIASKSGDEALFLVPDRDGDGVDDQIIYQLDSNILSEKNGDASQRIIRRDVASLKFEAAPQVGSQLSIPQARFDAVSHTVVSNKKTIQLSFPSGTLPGDFVVLIASWDKKLNRQSLEENGWTLITNASYEARTVHAWYKRAVDGEDAVTIEWSPTCNAAATALRFMGVSTTNPLQSHNLISGEHESDEEGPNAPVIALSEPGGLVLQVLLTNKNALSNGTGGLTSHMTCMYAVHENLVLTCSTRQAGSATGLFDRNNAFQFTRDADYVALGIGLAAE